MRTCARNSSERKEPVQLSPSPPNHTNTKNHNVGFYRFSSPPAQNHSCCDMGRTKTNPARVYFDYCKEKDSSLCRLCGRYMKTNHAANLERHLMRIHAEEFGAVQQQKASACPEPRPPKSFDVVNMRFDERRLVDACFELVVINGCPLEMMEYSGFRKLIDPIVEGIDGDFVMDVARLRSNFLSVANGIVQNIKVGLRNNQLSLKIDVVTGFHGAILTVSVQFVKDGEFYLHTLAVKELLHNQMNFINDAVAETLDLYNIDPNQIYSITFDSDCQIVDKPDYFSNESTLEINYPVQDTKILAHKCIAAALHLAIDDSLNDQNVTSVLDEYRNFVKRLASSTDFEKYNMQNLCTDSPTQWLTTYEMLERFFECNQESTSIIKPDPDFDPSSDEWQNLKAIYEGLKPLKLLSGVLKKDNFPMSDFFGLWIECKIKLEKIENFYTNILLKCMNERELNMMNDESFLASVYLDPRFQLLLSMEQKMRARIHLEQLWETIQKTFVSLETNNKVCVNELDSNNQMEADDELEKMLKMKEIERDMKTFVPSDLIRRSLLNFDGIQRIARKKNVLKYWEHNKLNNPGLYELAKVVYGIPASYLTLERAFSVLKDVHYKHKFGSLDSDTEKILFIRLNLEIT